MKIKNIIHLGMVDSTNNYARGLVMHKASEEGAVVLARHQSRGRGHGQNAWESEKGRNLTFSVILKPAFLDPARQFCLSMVASLGICDFLSEEIQDVKIKWPNDIYFHKKKLGGILIENILTGRSITDSIVGVGLNINQEAFPASLPNPVSLKQLTNKEYNLDDCLYKICSNIFVWYEKLKAGEIKKIFEAYVKNLFRLNEWSEYKKGGSRFSGRITGIDESGRLKVETRNEGILSFAFKEVEYIIIDKEG